MKLVTIQCMSKVLILMVMIRWVEMIRCISFIFMLSVCLWETTNSFFIGLSFV
jgi:hypothetical protein